MSAFNSKEKFYSQNAIEIFRKKKKIKIKPTIKGLKVREQIAQELIKHFLIYWSSFFFWLYVALFEIPMILLLGSIMWTLGFIATKGIPEREYEIATRTRDTMLKYTATLLGWRIVVFIITKTPTSVWEKALSMSLPPAFNSAFLGFIAMAFTIGMFVVFISYIGYIFQLFGFHKSRKKIKEQITIYVRRGGVM